MMIFERDFLLFFLILFCASFAIPGQKLVISRKCQDVIFERKRSVCSF